MFAHFSRYCEGVIEDLKCVREGVGLDNGWQVWWRDVVKQHCHVSNSLAASQYCMQCKWMWLM